MGKRYDELVLLQISDFRYSVGGEHFYGKLRFAHRQDDRCVELQRPMSAKEVIYLTKKDSAYSPKYKPGDLTDRFISQQAVKEAALKEWRKHFPEAKVLVCGGIAVCDPQEVIDGDEPLVSVLRKFYSDFEATGGHDGPHKAEASRISDAHWSYLCEEIGNEPQDQIGKAKTAARANTTKVRRGVRRQRELERALRDDDAAKLRKAPSSRKVPPFSRARDLRHDKGH